MTTTPRTGDGSTLEAGDRDPPQSNTEKGASSKPAPPVALRTYMAIRMGVVAVIVALGIAVWREIASSPDHCVQRSLSAYYYTPVRPVFVGALLMLGFAMIVMWGMTSAEDSVLNLAGLLLMVVALVPTLDANYCSLPKALRRQVPDTETKKIADDALIKASADAVSRSFTALLAVATLILVSLVVAGAVVYFRTAPDERTTNWPRFAYVVTWVLAAAAVVINFVLYLDADNPDSAFNHQVHGASANLAVALIIVAVMLAARHKGQSNDATKTRWVWRYRCLAGAMVLTATVIKGGDRIKLFSGWEWVDDHATFLVEAILIALIGVFWILQTIDRRGKGAPTY